MEKKTLADSNVRTAVEALTLAYTGYFVPLRFTEDALEGYLRANDIALDASPLWIRDGKPAAIGLIGIRGDRAWVGAFGLAPEYRGQGLAQAMFGDVVRQAKRQKVKSIQLEVLDRNVRAIRIYQRAGFTVTRKLYTLESPALEPDTNVSETIDPGEAMTWPEAGGLDHCWQREDRSVALRMPNLKAERSGDSYAVFRADGGEVSLLRTKLSGSGGSDLIAALARHSHDGKLVTVNEPEGSPLLRELFDRDWTPTSLQYEMRLAV